MIYFLDEIIEPINKPYDKTTIIITSITLFVVVITAIISALIIKKNKNN